MANVTPDTQDEQDRAYSPEEIRQREQTAPLDQPSSDETNVADAEENPNPQTNDIASSYSGKNNKKAKSFLEGKGPIVAITGSLGLGGFALLFLLVPGILLFHILANAFDTLDPSSTALSQVAKIMLLNKLGAGANEATMGSCKAPLTIACKFKTPSNQLLRDLRDNGIVATDADGKPLNLDTKEKWPSQRPVKFQVSSFHAEDGKEFFVEAKNLKSALQGNTTFRLAFNKVLKNINSRAFSRLSPGFLKVMKKFDFNLRDKLNIKERLNSKAKSLVTDLLEKALKATAGEGTAEAAKAITESISVRISKALTQLGRVSKGSGVVLGMAIQCMVNQMPSMLKKALGAMQETAAVNMAAPVVTSISAIKIGDGDPETASELGTMFTETDANGKSMLDAAGMKYTLYGDKNTTDDPTFKNVTADAYGDLGNFLTVSDAIFNNPVSATFCATLMNPIGGAAIAAGINAIYNASLDVETLGISFVANLAIGAAAGLVINSFSDNISDGISALLSPKIGEIAQPTIDKMAAAGQNSGNVFTFGVGALTTNSGANNFGNYLTTDELQAYTQDIQAQRLADAELDRATLSPFDTSSRYTFLGSMVNQLTPYYSSLSSVNGSVSVLGSLLPISVSSLFDLSTAHAADASLYDGACYNSELTKTSDGSNKTLAANIFCQPIPAQLISEDWDPSATLSSMQGLYIDGIAAIDKDTGAPIEPDPLTQTGKDLVNSVTNIIPGAAPSYYDWLDTCTDPESANACINGDNDTVKTYSLYTAARNVNTMLDNDFDDAAEVAGQDPEPAESPGTSANSVLPVGGQETSTPSDGTDSTETPATNEPAAQDTTSGYSSEAATKTLGLLASIVSPISNFIYLHSTNLFHSNQSSQLSLLASLERFTLWR